MYVPALPGTCRSTLIRVKICVDHALLLIGVVEVTYHCDPKEPTRRYVVTAAMSEYQSDN
jgi:hypothetical protein